jgi:hypothetical protein
LFLLVYRNRFLVRNERAARGHDDRMRVGYHNRPPIPTAIFFVKNKDSIFWRRGRDMGAADPCQRFFLFSS